MAQQTSRMYGIKVKEKVNYYEFGDAGTGKQITISYENKIWTIKAGGQNTPTGDVSWFMGGTEYQKGDVIDTFNDGDQITYTIMEQDRSETPYVNLMYDVYGNSAHNSKCGNSDVVYKVTSGDKNIYPTYTCKVYKMENGIIVGEKSFTNKDINRHKQMYEQGTTKYPLYTIFNNIAFDWDENTLMFTAISNSNYIKYNNNTYSKNEPIRSFRTTVFEGFEIIDETNKHEAVKVDPNNPPIVKLVKRHGGLTMMTAEKDHDTIFSDVFHDHKDVYYNGHYHDAMYLVYDNPTADGCWKKKLNSIALTYADPYWFLMTTSAGIEYGGRTYEARKLIRSWKPETSVNITLKETISRRKPIPDDENYDRFVYNVIEEDGQDAVFVYYYQIVATEDEEGIHDEYVLVDSVGFTSSDTQAHNPINWKNIKFKLENNVWTIMTRNAYITYEGRELKSNKPIKSFNVRGAINIEIGDNSDKKGASADKFVYDVEELEGQDSITVKFQQVVNQKDAEGHTHKTYIDLDQRTFTSVESPVTFRNIQFKANSGKWTIYSKCGYIKFNGRTYPNNRSILSFAISEAIHIEIADESNIYEVKEQRIYNIKTPNSEITVGYSIITSEMTRALKLIKMSGSKEEPWVTVNFYEAMYEPYVYDDISVRYDAKETKWELYSNSDNLYYNGTNYKAGSKIGESWSYYTMIKVTGMTVIHANSEALQMSVQIIKDGKVVKNVDIDEDIGWYDPEDLDFHLGYSYAKGLWMFRAIHNCWVDGINYSTGSVIKSFKTRLNVDQFTMMFRHYDDEERPDIPTNVLYYVTTSVDPFSGVTTVDINCPGHGSNSYSDKDTSKEADKAYTFTKADAKSMYGYIWKRFGGPTPPVPGIFDFLCSTSYGYRSGSVYLESKVILLDVTTTKLDEEYHLSTSGNVYLYKLLPGRPSFTNRIFALMASQYHGDYSQLLFMSDDFGKTWKVLRENGVDLPYTYIDGTRTYGIHVCSRNKMYQRIGNRFIKYTIMENGNLVKESDAILQLPENVQLTDAAVYFEDVNVYDSIGFTSAYKNPCSYSVSGEIGWYDTFCWYDLDNEVVVTTLRDYLIAYVNNLNDTYASFRYDPVSWRDGDRYWTYFANMRCYWYEETDTWVEYTDDRPDIYSNTAYLNYVKIDNEIDAGDYRFLYFKIACYEKWRKVSNPPSSGEAITENLGGKVIRYNVNTGEVISLDISDESWHTLFHPSSSGYYEGGRRALKYFNGEYYWYQQSGSKFVVLKFDITTGTASVVKEYESGQSILVKYFNRSSSWSNDYIRIYFLSGAMYSYGVRKVSDHMYECQIDPGTVISGMAMNELSVPRWINADNFEGSGSGYNKRLTFKKSHYTTGTSDGSGVVFVFDNPLLESRLSFGFRDDYYY